MQNLQLNNDMLIISPAIKVWTGKCTLKPEDFPAEVRATLPPKTLASLGSKYLTDPAPIKELAALRTWVDARLATYGVRFFGGVLISHALLQDAINMLEEQAKAFSQKVADFLLEYPTASATWAAQYPEYERALLAAAPSVNVLREKFGFTYQVFTINAVDTGDQTQYNDTTQLIDQVPNQIIRDAIKEVVSVRDTTFSNSAKITKRCYKAIDQLLDRLRHLTFLNSTVQLAVDLIEQGDRQYRSMPLDDTCRMTYQNILTHAENALYANSGAAPAAPPVSPAPAAQAAPVTPIKTAQPAEPVKPAQPAEPAEPVKPEPLFVTDDSLHPFSAEPAKPAEPQSTEDLLNSLFGF